jgi:hypothetical protein
MAETSSELLVFDGMLLHFTTKHYPQSPQRFNVRGTEPFYEFTADLQAFHTISRSRAVGFCRETNLVRIYTRNGQSPVGRAKISARRGRLFRKTIAAPDLSHTARLPLR